MSALLHAEDLRPQRADGSLFEHGLSLEVGGDRIICLVGPNGSGKTAYLRALAGVDPAAGKLRILDRDVAALDTPAWRKLRCRVAFIGEGAPLLSVVDGISNVTLPALYHRLGTRELVHAQALELLHFLGYPGQQDALPAYLNQHQRLLLAIARCLMLSPELLFLDEPFHMTDEDCRKRESDVYLKLARERGLAVLVSTHNLGFVKRHAQEIVFIHPQSVQRFPDWNAFAGTPLPAVQQFLHAAA
ncbi:MAG TPA: ATP-binding cassette domain-containing protein [Gammaproteobacteria bacterium]|nr:ATP-binding cassette domain-containing protein [Gammaproteobacteria bacterium]